jgi:hypothetical protein
MATTTPAEIRDRAIAVIAALTPQTDPHLTFRPYRNEGGADFRAFCEANPSACTRRFQARTVGGSVVPLVSNMDTEEHEATLEVTIAYQQAHRWGDSALERDDVADQDVFEIDQAIGMLGKANFSPPFADATWHPDNDGVPDRDAINGVEFVTMRVRYFYFRSR